MEADHGVSSPGLGLVERFRGHARQSEEAVRIRFDQRRPASDDARQAGARRER